jgi:hypothetical protein
VSGVIRWEEPPPPGSYDWDAITQALRAQPGKWALIAEPATVSLATTLAYQVRTGRRPHTDPPGAFEARSSTKAGTNRVYARYVGGES